VPSAMKEWMNLEFWEQFLKPYSWFHKQRSVYAYFRGTIIDDFRYIHVPSSYYELDFLFFLQKIMKQ
jgi:hypothetical protein